jgi:hypothetical protein
MVQCELSPKQIPISSVGATALFMNCYGVLDIVGSAEHSNEILYSIKGEFFDQEEYFSVELFRYFCVFFCTYYIT